MQWMESVITQHMQLNVYDHLPLNRGNMHLREEPRQPDFFTTYRQETKALDKISKRRNKSDPSRIKEGK